MGDDSKNRCEWCLGAPEYIAYHDNEWGVPVHDDRKHFEMLTLEGAQAGLSWETILKRRKGYAKAFKRFNPKVIAKMTDKELEVLLKDESIIRNRLKVYSTRSNAQIFLAIQNMALSDQDCQILVANSNHNRARKREPKVFD